MRWDDREVLRPRSDRPEGEPSNRADPGHVTVRSYQAGAEPYIRQSPPASPAVLAFLDQLVELVGTGRVLELGSCSGRDASYLEDRGLRVTRSDATPAFVEIMREAGQEARLLDVRTDNLDGPYDAVLANAVLLHLTREQFEEALPRIRRAVIGSGVLACTLKDGDGAGWSEAKIGLPRYFTYWREHAVREVLATAGWAVISIDHVAGRSEHWIHVLARAGSDPVRHSIGQ